MDDYLERLVEDGVRFERIVGNVDADALVTVGNGTKTFP